MSRSIIKLLYLLLFTILIIDDASASTEQSDLGVLPLSGDVITEPEFCGVCYHDWSSTCCTENQTECRHLREDYECDRNYSVCHCTACCDFHCNGVVRCLQRCYRSCGKSYE